MGLGYGREDRTTSEGDTYTRGTLKCMESTSADEELGLTVSPTGNATPDYFEVIDQTPWKNTQAR